MGKDRIDNKEDLTKDKDQPKVHFFKEMPRNLFTGVLVFIPLIIVILIIRLSVDTVLTIGSNLLGITKSVELTFVLVLMITLLIIYSGYKFRKREQWFLNYIERLIISVPFILNSRTFIPMQEDLPPYTYKGAVVFS
jgi:hypothetical protein